MRLRPLSVSRYGLTLFVALGALTLSTCGGAARPASTDPTSPSTASVPSSTGDPPAALEPDGPGGTWNLTFDANFNGSSLNASDWKTCYDWDCTNAGNNELEWYTANNVTVSGGQLHLTVVKQPDNGKPYTSGMVQSNGKYTFTYGFAEIRAKLPAGKGLWPAFWMLPTNKTWPPEIDIMEFWGDHPNTVLMNEFIKVNGAPTQYPTFYTGPNFTAGYHTFGVDWEPHKITWYVDGVVRKVENVSITTPMYLLANLAVSGSDPPNQKTAFPSAYDIKYIRVWQH